MASNSSDYDNLRLRMEGYGGVEKFWSFDPKLPNRPPYAVKPWPAPHLTLTEQNQDLQHFYLHNVSAFVRYLAFFLSGSGNAAFNVRMSFGFSVGDFIAILKLANNIRERFVDAPEQFKAISDE